MAATYSIIQTIEDASENQTIVTPVFSGSSSNFTKGQVMSIASEIANNFKMENSFRRVELDCIETNENAERIIFKNIPLENPSFGKAKKSDLDKLVDQINEENRNA